MFRHHLLSVLLPSSPCLNFIQMARFARELGMSNMPGLAMSEIPGSYKCYEKKPNTNPTSQEEESEFGNESGWRHEHKLNLHNPLKNPRWSLLWPCGSLFIHRATTLWFFQTGKITIFFFFSFELVVQHWANSVIFGSPKCWGLQPVGSSRDTEPTSSSRRQSLGLYLSW